VARHLDMFNVRGGHGSAPRSECEYPLDTRRAIGLRVRRTRSRRTGSLGGRGGLGGVV